MKQHKKKVRLKSPWEQFDVDQTRQRGGDLEHFALNFVNISVPANTTHFDHVREIAISAREPFAVKFVSDQLRERRYFRARYYSNFCGKVIQDILNNYPDLRWWLEKDGLVIDKLVADLSRLGPFDRFAGKLVISKWTLKRLSFTDLQEITSAIDANNFNLKENLQQAQWKAIADHNMKSASKAVKTFRAAADNQRLVRHIRRRLCLARTRYLDALGR